MLAGNGMLPACICVLDGVIARVRGGHAGQALGPGVRGLGHVPGDAGGAARPGHTWLGRVLAMLEAQVMGLGNLAACVDRTR